MSETSRPAVRRASPGDESPECNASPTIKARRDIDGCGCLECRNIETIALNRTVLDMLLWSVGLLRSYPSIVAFSGVIILANRLLETDAVTALPTPAIGVFEAVTAFAFVVFIRAYVGIVVAEELTAADSGTVRERVRRAVARIPSLVGLSFLLVFSVITIPFLVSLPLFVLLTLVPGNPVETFGFPVVAAVGGIAFALPFLLLLFKFWFALEACVIGRYGPVESLRISWRITTNYRAKLLVVVLLAVGGAVALYLPDYVPGGSSGLVSPTPVLGVISTSAGELLSVVWAGAYAHIYVQGIVD